MLLPLLAVLAAPSTLPAHAARPRQGVAPPRVAAATAPRGWWTTEVAKLVASDPGPVELFGRSLDLDAHTLVVGASHDHGAASYSGAAYVFERVGGGWFESARLLAPDGEVADFFGTSVALEADTLVVGVPFDDDAGYNAGAAWVFVRQGHAWTPQAKLMPSDLAPEDHLGIAVALDGDTALVGAHLHDAQGMDSGAAWVFVRSGGSWVEQAKLAPAGASPGARSGWAVAVQGDRALTGAPYDGLAAPDGGAVHVFARGGSGWGPGVRLEPSSPTPGLYFGAAVSIDADWIAVGATGDGALGPAAGAVHTFRHTGSSWAAGGLLRASDGQAHDRFGHALSLSGNRLVVGAHRNDLVGFDAGSVWGFERSGQHWLERAVLRPLDGEAEDLFGWSVALDGDTLAASAVLEDEAAFDAGAAYVFRVGW